MDKVEIPIPIELSTCELVLSDNQPLMGDTIDITRGTDMKTRPAFSGEYSSFFKSKKGINSMTLNIAIKLIRALILAAANCLFLKWRISRTGCFVLISMLIKIMKNTTDDTNNKTIKLESHPFSCPSLNASNNETKLINKVRAPGISNDCPLIFSSSCSTFSEM